MKNLFVFIAFTLGLWITTSCSSDLSEEIQKCSIVGSVADATTGEPVPVVNVKLSPGGSSAITGSDGSFSFSELDPGEYTLSISKEGYKNNTSEIYVTSGVPSQVHLQIERIPASITSDKDLLDFGEKLTTLSFTIVNSSYTDLAYNLEIGSCEWLSTNPKEGVLDYGKTATIVVTVDRSKLPAGVNEANIVVSSTSGDGNVEVKVKAINNAGASVNTLNVTNIEKTAATLNGEITNTGSPSYIERGFVYDIQSTPTVSKCIKKLSSPVTPANEYSCNIEGLSPIQTYYVRAYIIQNKNVIYGNTVSFTTSQQATTVSTSAVTKIGASSATFNAQILEIGSPAYTERGFCYSRNSTPSITDNRRPVEGTGAGSFSLSVTNLEYPVTYYVRAYAIQSGGTVYGNIVSFTTSQRPTVLTTSAVTDIHSNTAIFNASISNVGLPAYTERGFCYSTNGNPSIANNRLRVSGSGAGNYSVKVTNLQCPALYYVRAYAIQDGNAIYGNSVSFNTELKPVSVSTSAATEISTNSAKLNGVITYAGDPVYSQRGFCYSTQNSKPTISDNKVSMYASNTGSFHSTVKNLKQGTTYYVRAFAYQDNRYEYGSTVSFKTNTPPSVRTDAVTSLEKNDMGGGLYFSWRATLNATVLSAGSPEYNGCGFVYGTSVDPRVGSGTNIAASSSGTGRFSVTVNDLTNMQYYYIRAYVKVGKVYYYGESVKISTF